MKVTFAYPYTDKSGKEHKPDSTADLPEGEAMRVIHDGRGRAESEPEKGKTTTTEKGK